jgi:hypothetical protein
MTPDMLFDHRRAALPQFRGWACRCQSDVAQREADGVMPLGTLPDRVE